MATKNSGKKESSAIVTAEYSADQLEAALSLASELGISLEDTPSISEGYGGLTRYTLPEGIRYTVTYFDSGDFSWNAEGQPAEFKEEFFKRAGDEMIPVSGFNEVGGYIVDFELQPRLSTYSEDDKKTKVTCSVVGYATNDIDTGENIVVRALPPVPMKAMYKWVGNSMSYTTPEPLVEKLGLVGSRGEMCAQCIKNGHSTMEVQTKQGPKVESCTVRGVLYMVVHELTKVTKKASKVPGQDPEEVRTTYKVEDLCDEDGNAKEPFLLAVNVTSLGLRGAWNNEPRITGYFHHVSGLEKEFKGRDPRRNPSFHFTTITLRKKDGGNKFQLDFQKYPSDLMQVKSAIQKWKTAKPQRDVEVIPQSDYSGFRGEATPADLDNAIEVDASSDFAF